MKTLLKFLTCGSVDDGKSTLIGHLLYDAKLLFTDQEQALELDSKIGSRGGKIDYSLLLDGLMAEREQGITIDVAYRYFTTQKRSFIVADTPGHEEYTRNMAVGASFADLAVILVDASKGILVQTRRHLKICALMGIKHIVFAVNKMDLVSYSQQRFNELENELLELVKPFEFFTTGVIPVCATEGDNITTASKNMCWYKKSTLLSYLEEIDVENPDENASAKKGFVLPVQRVCRPDFSFRGFQGQIECGKIRVGEQISVLPSGETAAVKAIFCGAQKVDFAEKGQPVTIQLEKEIDVSRGCVLVNNAALEISNMFTASILWMDEQELVEGKSYLIKIGTQKLSATVLKIKYKIDINTDNHIAGKTVSKNEIACCDFALEKKAVVSAFKEYAGLGRFILIDRLSNMTSACGIIEHTLRRSDNLVWQQLDITRQIRAAKMGQKPVTIWFTGLSGSGKSTLANQLEKALNVQGRFTMLLDGDNVRMGLNKNLGFTQTDRIENIRRIAEVCRLMNDAGLIVLTAFISPFESDRENARKIIGLESFIEVYVNTPLEECEKRDVKGLYKKAREGKIPNFTGISSPYEPPLNAQITIDTSKMPLEECVQELLLKLEKYIK